MTSISGLPRWMRGWCTVLRAQNQIQILFTAPRGGTPLLDILILHVFSLSWDDLATLSLAPDAVLVHIST